MNFFAENRLGDLKMRVVIKKIQIPFKINKIAQEFFNKRVPLRCFKFSEIHNGFLKLACRF